MGFVLCSFCCLKLFLLFPPFFLGPLIQVLSTQCKSSQISILVAVLTALYEVLKLRYFQGPAEPYERFGQ